MRLSHLKKKKLLKRMYKKRKESYIDTIPQPDEFEDPLDKPAFMRKIFKKKE